MDDPPCSLWNVLLKTKLFLMHVVFYFSSLLTVLYPFLLMWLLLNQIYSFILAWKQIGC